MRFQFRKPNNKSSLSLFLKSGAILIFLIFSILIVACGSNDTTNSADLGNPVITVTIRIGQFNGSATPALAPYYCGAWATNTSPQFIAGVIDVYAKFTQNVDGNPVGVNGANATATVLWPDGSTNSETVTTQSDGIAIFPVALKPVATGKTVLINVTFTKPGIPSCTVPQAAYFTSMFGSPIANNTPTNATPIGSPTAAATASPSPLPTVPPTPTPTPRKPRKTPTPKPH
jgi:hypothetical protein